LRFHFPKAAIQSATKLPLTNRAVDSFIPSATAGGVKEGGKASESGIASIIAVFPCPIDLDAITPAFLRAIQLRIGGAYNTLDRVVSAIAGGKSDAHRT
jgi:hypothetical protein